ncbi:protein downstream neighbor of son homolog [Saccostrea echinata]|uniref:protein downstream neighbor of son homolog n=1 Tax=Saccostrea echinata TaxID=191078 RepID=UPI002A800E82|nr:protein downstream neighbor of son homolog [Saccostrea echinata]
MSESSPKWKRPSDVMKIHRKRKRLSQSRSFSEEKSNTSGILHDSTNVFLNSSSKRKNPFSSNDNPDAPYKRKKSDGNEKIPSFNENTQAFFAILEKANKKEGDSPSIKVEKATENGPITREFLVDDDEEKSQFDFIEKFFKAAQTQKLKDKSPKPLKTEKAQPTSCKPVPVDWSLKVKLRVVSKSSLLWCTQIKTAEEAKGVTDFVSGCSQVDAVEDKSDFYSCCLYWIYPNLPWLRLFPRIVPDSKIRSSSNGLLGEDIQKSLLEDWTESFTSAFHQLRSQHCPYFYFCTHQFTVLFRAAGVAGQSSQNAFLTPTTRGLREALKNEGIEFSMPVLERKRESSSAEKSQSKDSENQSTHPAEDEDEEDEFLDTDEGASVWLESIGLDKKQFPSLDPNKVKIQREGFRVIDNRPESLIYVQGADVQALFNFLLNCRSCVASSGPQVGVAPTILSPSPFRGASVQTQKVKHSLVKQTETDGSINHVHILEISGAVLPHHVHHIRKVLERTQKGEFTLTFNTHEPTVPFNAKLSVTDCNPERERMKMRGDKFDSFFDVCEIDDRLTCIRELYCKDYEYNWAT